MKSLKQLKPKQLQAYKFINNNLSTFLIADMGTGKTVITLAAIKSLIDKGKIRNCLILGPKDPIRLTWPTEIDKWVELKNLDYVLLRSPKKYREQKLREQHQVYLLNYENMSWLFQEILQINHERNTEEFPFDMLVCDESVCMASISNDRFKKWKNYFQYFTYRVCLTAKPTPQSAQSWYGQIYVLDSGKTYGHNFSKWQEKYFQRTRSQYVWKEPPGAKKILFEETKQYIFRLEGEGSKYEREIIYLNLPAYQQGEYKKIEKKMFIEIKDQIHTFDSKVTALGKCSQYVGGNLYVDKPGPWEQTYTASGKKRRKPVETKHIHDVKIKALSHLLFKLEDKRCIIAYQYEHEKLRILEKLPEITPFDSKIKETLIEQWNNKEINWLLVHPASSSRGLNLQFGGHTFIWYSLPWSVDQYEQSIGRLDRQEQTEQVMVYILLMSRTIDVVKYENLRAQITDQEEFLKLIKRYQEGKL